MVKVKKYIDSRILNRAQISRILDHVVREYTERSDIQKLDEIDVYVTKDPLRVSKKIFSEAKLERYGELKDWILSATPHFSYWERGKVPIILINANEKIFKDNNWEAVRGLVAHELIHILNKMDGIEETLEEQLKKASTSIYDILKKHREVPPFTKDRLYSSLIKVTTTASLIIKDILANTRAMSFGFDEQIFENYRVVLEDAKLIRFSEKDIVRALKKGDKSALDDVFLAYIGINSTWITFKMFHNKWYRELQELSDLEIPEIMKEYSKPLFDEMMKLRSTKRKRETLKILVMTQQIYYNLVKYFSHKLEINKGKHKKVK